MSWLFCLFRATLAWEGRRLHSDDRLLSRSYFLRHAQAHLSRRTTVLPRWKNRACFVQRSRVWLSKRACSRHIEHLLASNVLLGVKTAHKSCDRSKFDCFVHSQYATRFLQQILLGRALCRSTSDGCSRRNSHWNLSLLKPRQHHDLSKE